MGEFFEDRRQEPRFSTAGHYLLNATNGKLQGRILDLSLNGALLERDGNAQLKAGERLVVSLEFEGYAPFSAEVLVIRSEGMHLGIEFYDMDPLHFSALSNLIDSLNQAQRQTGTTTNA